ncbi:hypothetical protein LAZ67_22000125 [Cordylochernes scorpioides]|uniref:Mariner Mos1 transposase n=1 Tax=Cordylochernes scorpioides TaxID=51811 RepID=A0ABY6LPW0_9ARAC|nr:hypothetical protein LAZ67_22000125 [Cordylochernes scorpioides]
MFLRSQRSVGKVLLTIFWDVDGPIGLEFLSSRQRMNSDLYCDILVNKLKPGIRNKRRGKLSKGVLFLHDNARPHTSCKTVSIIIKLAFEVLEHPAYSPDLASSDYFLFGLLKKELKGKRFDSNEDVQKVVQDFFHTLPKSAYKEGIYKLPERWRRCIERQDAIRVLCLLRMPQSYTCEFEGIADKVSALLYLTQQKEYNSRTCLQPPRQKNPWRRGCPLVKHSAPHYTRAAWTTPPCRIIHTPRREHCYDRDVWRHLRLFIGHHNNNNHPVPRYSACCDRDVWRYLRLFIGHDNNNNHPVPRYSACCDRDVWRYLRLFIGHHNNNNHPVPRYSACCDRDVWRYLRLFIGHHNNNNHPVPRYSACCDRDVWRYLRLFIGHHNNNNHPVPRYSAGCDRDVWRYLRLFIGHHNNNNHPVLRYSAGCDRDVWRYLRLFIGHHNNNNHPVPRYSACCDRDVWRYLRLFIGHHNNNNHPVPRYSAGCDRDVWRHLRLYIGHDNNNNEMFQ